MFRLWPLERDDAGERTLPAEVVMIEIAGARRNASAMSAGSHAQRVISIRGAGLRRRSKGQHISEGEALSDSRQTVGEIIAAGDQLSACPVGKCEEGVGASARASNRSVPRLRQPGDVDC